jgi:predicted enzyme related to lactoylglutathione lyase
MRVASNGPRATTGPKIAISRSRIAFRSCTPMSARRHLRPGSGPPGDLPRGDERADGGRRGGGVRRFALLADHEDARDLFERVKMMPDGQLTRILRAMAIARFTRFTLRTSNVEAARRFYAALLGHEQSEVLPLHEQAVARGARPHWLGQIEVEEVDRTAEALIERGATRMGQSATFPDGHRFAVLRDPGGAVLGLVSPSAYKEPNHVVWHQLNTLDLEKVTAAYAELFGWQMTELKQHAEHGAFQQFRWPDSDHDCGAITDITGEPGRHPHWLFQFRVPDLARAVELVRAAGGLVLGPFAWGNGERVAVCDDPQGAAFALRG